MKLLIGYDGSESSQSALRDLARAGLVANAEVMLVAVIDVWDGLLSPDAADRPVQPVAGASEPTDSPEWGPGASRLGSQIYGLSSRELAIMDYEAAKRDVARAAGWVQGLFPEWKVVARVRTGVPAEVLAATAVQWNADLLIVGSRGRSRLAAALLGGTAQTLLASAHCPVRIARAPDATHGNDRKPRLLIGLDVTTEAAVTVDAVAARRWPPGTAARIVTAVDSLLAATLDCQGAAGIQDCVAVAQQAATEKLRSAGLVVDTVVRHREAHLALLGEASEWPADCVFIGSKGGGGLVRQVLGSVSTAVAANARCSVEVCRVSEGRAIEVPA